MFIFAISCITVGVIFIFPALTSIFADNSRKYGIILMTFAPLLIACVSFISYETISTNPIYLKLTFAAIALLAVGWIWALVMSVKSSLNRRFKPARGGRMWMAEIILCVLSLVSFLLPFSVTDESHLTGIESFFAAYNEGLLPFILMLLLIVSPVALVIIGAVCRRGNAPYVAGVIFSGVSSISMAVLGSFLGFFNQFGAILISILWLGIALFSLLGAPVRR